MMDGFTTAPPDVQEGFTTSSLHSRHRFLQVLTRCYRRPHMLWANIQSLEAQTDPDWQQTMLVDGEPSPDGRGPGGRGVGQAQAMLANHAPYVRGAYVWVLDDDDLCIRPRLVQEVKAIASEFQPDVIVVRMDHERRGVLPDDAHWQREPEHGFIGGSALIVRRDVWQRHAPAYQSAHYASDFDFIRAVFDADPEVYWHDVIASKVQRISMGEPE